MSRPTAYQLLSNEQWRDLIEHADSLAAPCRLCPRRCGVDRFHGQQGFCRAPGELHISSIFPHHGEEPPISATGGSGTVFFSSCTLRCIFCQNYQISHLGEGRAYEEAEFAGHLLRLQDLGCHNVNLVTATHFLPWVLRALKEACGRGLRIPVVYNCGGYESIETIELLRAIVDIYLPDMKYADNEAAMRLSSARDYVEVNQAAVRTMFRQVGPLRVDGNGVAYRGLCIRHLVLPNGLSGSERIASFLLSAFDPADLTVSLMAQYRPLHRVAEFADVNRRITRSEYEAAKRAFEAGGIGVFFQDAEELDERFVIDFTKRTYEPLTGE